LAVEVYFNKHIPVKSWNSTVLSMKFTAPAITPESVIKRAEDLGWKVERMFPKAMHITSLSKKLYIGRT